MSTKNSDALGCITGVKMRSRARTNACAVAGVPSEKRASLRIVNVYVLRSVEITG